MSAVPPATAISQSSGSEKVLAVRLRSLLKKQLPRSTLGGLRRIIFLDYDAPSDFAAANQIAMEGLLAMNRHHVPIVLF